MKTITELKTYEIKLLKKYCEKILYVFKIFGEDINNILKQCIIICDNEIEKRSVKK